MSEHTITLRFETKDLADAVHEALRHEGLDTLVVERTGNLGGLVEQSQRELLEVVRGTGSSAEARDCAEAFERITKAWTAYQSARKQFSF